MLFVPGGMAVATKKSSTPTGSFLVVKSTRLSATTQAELGSLTVFSPTQKTEANEYASIITRADASGQPAPPVDAARLAVLEGISSNTLVDADRGDVLKFVMSARLVDFAKVAAVAPLPDPLIGTKLHAVPFWNGSEIEDIAVATITSTENLYVTASDDSLLYYKPCNKLCNMGPPCNTTLYIRSVYKPFHGTCTRSRHLYTVTYTLCTLSIDHRARATRLAKWTVHTLDNRVHTLDGRVHTLDGRVHTLYA